MQKQLTDFADLIMVPFLILSFPLTLCIAWIHSPSTALGATPSQVRIPVSGRPSAEDTLVDEAYRLIRAGEDLTCLDVAPTDLVLVIGNTGAGKTTITKFIAEAEKLESYDAGDGYLIRDNQDKISSEYTLVSKTIFPDLIIDTATRTAFYDLPGFSDTRNASVEIANAYFTKMIAERAERVKFLFIVNYSSLRTGQTRTDLITFLEHATDLIKNTLKFKSAIALVATKVESSLNPYKIIHGIVNFLKKSEGNLVEVIADENKRKSVQHLIGALLSKDRQGNYNRISYFKQPNEYGPLVGFPEVMDQRTHMKTMLHQGIQYVQKSPNDFGFTVSPKAKLIITKLAERMMQSITDTVRSLAMKIESHLETKIDWSTGWGVFRNLKKEQDSLEQMVASLRQSQTLKDFILSLTNMTDYLKIDKTAAPELKELLQRQKDLKFLEEIGGRPFALSVRDWSRLVQDSVDGFVKSDMAIKIKSTAAFIYHHREDLYKLWKNNKESSLFDYYQNIQKTDLSEFSGLVTKVAFLVLVDDYFSVMKSSSDDQESESISE